MFSRNEETVNIRKSERVSKRREAGMSDIMREVNKIYSMRKCIRGRRLFFQIVYEWEDILCKGLGMELAHISDYDFAIEIACRFINKTFHTSLGVKKKNKNKLAKALFFEMSTTKYDGFLNQKDVICCVIDYFVPQEEFLTFAKKHNKAELLLISSREVYEYLLQKKCPLNLAHFPLSISDQWMFNEKKYEKMYDIVLTGRLNRVLFNWLIQYVQLHSDTKILVADARLKTQIQELLGGKDYQITVKVANSRKQYMSNLQAGKVMLYATPGMDEGKKRTNGWNQVTPRFLEGIAAQCHVIMRYEDNADTRWYCLSMFSESCDSYEKFSMLMEKYLAEEIDYDRYQIYLRNHLTSKRVALLKEIVANNISKTKEEVV